MGVWRRRALLLVGCGLVAVAAGLFSALAVADAGPVRVVLLHHSTGECVWNGGVPAFFERYNAAHETRYEITERAFPKDEPYGWENYPYDYWNIWVKHAGPRPWREEPTLEILTQQFDVIVFKHCFPVSHVEADTGRPDVASSEKRLENYKLQYQALRQKLRSFRDTKFVVWTGAALLESDTDAAQARRARAFFTWVKDEWDEKGDNVFVWDFHALETDGGFYLKPAFAEGAGDAHPNAVFSRRVAPLLGQRLVDVIEGRGDTGDVTGKGGKPLPPVSAQPEPEPEVEPEPEPEPEPRTEAAPEAAPDVPSSATSWTFDDAEDADRLAARWGKLARYVTEAGRRVIALDFEGGERQDWGEYGPHRILRTAAPEKDVDLKPYRYLALRVRADRALSLPVALVTRPVPRPEAFEPRFGFSAYLSLEAGRWQTVVLDLTKLELEVEGPEFYERVGRPTRPEGLTHLRFCVHEREVAAKIHLDDVVFLRELPATLRDHLHQH